MIADKIRTALNAAGLSECRVEQSTGRYWTARDGYTIRAVSASGRECILEHETAIPETASRTDAYLEACTGILKATGLTVRPALRSLALIVTDETIKPLEFSPSYSRPDIEVYRRQLLKDTGSMFRRAVEQNRLAGRYLTDEGKVNIRRKMQEIRTMPAERLEMLRQRLT